MMPVASTERVSRYTQNVRANLRTLVVPSAIFVFAPPWTRGRLPGGGVYPPPAGTGARSAADPSSSSVTLRG